MVSASFDEPLVATTRRQMLRSHLDSAAVWDLQGEEKPRKLSGHSGRVWSVAWSSDGNRLVTAGDDGLVRVWDLQGDEKPRELSGHRGRVWSVAWSPDDNRLVTEGDDGLVRVWDPVGVTMLAEVHTTERKWWTAGPEGVLHGEADPGDLLWYAAGLVRYSLSEAEDLLEKKLHVRPGEPGYRNSLREACLTHGVR